MMADREKVIKGLKCCSGASRVCMYVQTANECPYAELIEEDWCGGDSNAECTKALATDALELLKEQECLKEKCLVCPHCCNCDVDENGKISSSSVGGWISVKDRLPEATEPDTNGKIAYSKMVLVYLVYENGFTYQTVDTCRVDMGRWMHEVPGEGCRVTHWMPLPEPPKEGEVG